jgi:O-antigen/teichoic acid export membrane protein
VSKNLRNNIVAAILIKAISLLVNLALIPLGIRFLSPETYGVWVVVLSILTWLSFMDMGIGNSIRNKLTIALSNKHKNNVAEIISTSYVSISVFSILALVVLSVLIQAVSWQSLLNIYSVSETDLKRSLLLAFWLFGLQVILKNVIYIFHSLQLSFLNNLSLLLSSLLNYALLYIYTFKSNHASLEAFIALSIGSQITIYLAMNLWLFSTKLKHFRPRLKFVSRSAFDGMKNQGYSFFVIQIFTLLLFQGNSLLISHFYGGESVTEYNASNKVFGTVVLGFTIVLNPVWNSYTHALAKLDYTWIHNIHKKLLKSWLLASLGILVILSLSSWLFQEWLGSLISVSNSLNVANALYSIIYILCSIFTYLVNASGKITLQMILYIAGGLLFLPIAIALTHTVKDPSAIVYTNCLIMAIITLFLGIQARKILSRNTAGIWNR